MTSQDDEIGVLTTLVHRLERDRLPRVLEIKSRVDQGERLTDPDLRFLGEIMEDAKSIAPLIDNHPELHELASKVTTLYREISDKALENEKAGS